LENGYSYNYYGIERESNVLEFESKYIRDKESAKILRDSIYLQNCNRHLSITISLPLKYTFLEVGDVISFEKIINNLKAFGEDYTIENRRNGQIIHPYFIITSTNKSDNKIKLKCTQLHKLSSEFAAGKGSLTRMSEYGIDSSNPDADGFLDTSGDLFLEDFHILDSILNKDYKYITSSQKYNADVTGNKTINNNDLNLLNDLLTGIPDLEDPADSDCFDSTGDGFCDNTNEGHGEFLGTLGDLNNDGTINVVDIVILVSLILGTSEGSDYQIAAGDYNEDTALNVVDIVNIVNLILYGGD
jgi:hypothetical protein